jgi:hypothetical protein
MEPYNGIIIAIIYLAVETLKFFGKNKMAESINEIKNAVSPSEEKK